MRHPFRLPAMLLLAAVATASPLSARAAVDTAPGAAPTSEPASAPASAPAPAGDEDRYAAREAGSQSAAGFQGGDGSLYIGGGAVALLLVVLILVIVF